MILIDKRKRDEIILQYEQLLQTLREKEMGQDMSGDNEMKSIADGKEELEKVFSQYQLRYNELQYLISRYQTLHKTMRVQLRNIRIKIGLQSHK